MLSRYRAGIGATLMASLLAVYSPSATIASADPPGCLHKQGPVGAVFLDCSGGQVFNIIPPGEGSLGHKLDQEAMYANLVRLAPNLTAADISTYYKDASFVTDVAQAERVETFPAPHDGTVIIRDKQFGVPHIFGRTRADTEFGSGFAAAEDRLFVMDFLRHVGRAQLSSFLGPSLGNMAMDCSVAAAAGYSEAELQQQFDSFASKHVDLITIAGHRTTEGHQIVKDVNAYAMGVNNFISTTVTDPTKLPIEYVFLPIALQPWKSTDIIATATLFQAFFGTGGGNEVASALLYQSLVSRYPTVQGNGESQGANIWADLRSQNDPGAPVSIKTRFKYEQVPPPSRLDPNSLAMPTAPVTDSHCNPAHAAAARPSSAAAAAIDVSPLLSALHQGLPHSSNELIVDAAHSATRHPIAVFGPQTGYQVPNFLHEVDLHGPGLQARGVAFTGSEIYVQLGHGVDYAWSATSAGADITDQRIERLCKAPGTPAGAVDPNSQWYVFDDGKRGGPKCIQMYERTDTQPGLTIQVERTVHGPVVGRTSALDPATGQPIPVAVSSQRSTFGDELGATPAFMDWNDPDIIHNTTDFQRAAGKETGTFNWTYVDSHDVGYYMAGKLPVRNPHVNPNFPTWGTGQWEWQGFVPTDLSDADVHPRASTISSDGDIVNGTLANGFFTNWNNKPAPGFSAADNNFAYGPVYRVQSLSDRVKAILTKGPARPVDVINAMEDAGSVDLDGSQLVGPLSAALQGAALTPQQQQILQTLQQWAADPSWGARVPGAHRRDRSSSGSYEQGSAVAIMDQLYPRLAHAVFDPTLNSGQFDQLAALNPITNPPGAGGSAYDGGWEGYLQRALRQAVNPAIANGYSQNYCGKGSLVACQSGLQGALQGAIDSLAVTYGNPDPNAWTCGRSNTGAQCNPARDDIHFQAIGLAGAPAMPWINRPTFQQVVQYPGHRSGDDNCQHGGGGGGGQC